MELLLLVNIIRDVNNRYFDTVLPTRNIKKVWPRLKQKIYQNRYLEHEGCTVILNNKLLLLICYTNLDSGVTINYRGQFVNEKI